MTMRIASILLLLPFALSSPTPSSTTTTSSTPPKTTPLPLVIWHGLGDTYTNPGLTSLASLYQSLHHPPPPVHLIHISTSPSTDRTNTFYGHLPTQIQQICDQLSSLPPPFTDGFHALGLSQGGQFLRAYIQQCNFPPVHTLMTFGSQHMGISKFLGKCDPGDWVCKMADRWLENNKWEAWTQKNVVPAQYFRDPEDLGTYLNHSGWLADVNNEREGESGRNKLYAWKLASLHRFVMYLFENDTVVTPKHTSWFYDLDPPTGELIPLQQTNIYKQDWLGLKRLDSRGALKFETFYDTEHMRFSDEQALEAFSKYFGEVEEGWQEKYRWTWTWRCASSKVGKDLEMWNMAADIYILLGHFVIIYLAVLPFVWIVRNRIERRPCCDAGSGEGNQMSSEEKKQLPTNVHDNVDGQSTAQSPKPHWKNKYVVAGIIALGILLCLS